MPSVCFYFQVHQPYRIRPFSFFESSPSADYFDESANRSIMKKVAEKCYLPTNQLLLELIHRFEGRFRISYSITGVALEQMQRYAPEVLDSFQQLVRTGCVELLGETYYHSLAGVYHRPEFLEQIKLHRDLLNELFGVSPTVFRNTELIYNDAIGEIIQDLGYKAIIAEGADDILDWRSPNFLHHLPGGSLKLLLKNYRLSDDIAFRFGDRGWKSYPLRSETFAEWIHRGSGNAEVVNLFMDYETFGEHQWDSTGIFDFLRHLPEQILAKGDWDFATPTEVADRYPARGALPVERLTSWADEKRDLTAWNGNEIQERALREVYEIHEEILRRGDRELLDISRRLQTSDHFYYMCTKWAADGDVHAYFSPYDSPYDAFIYYMNVLRHLRARLGLQGEAEHHI
ncbi:glycoside hydrolase family 57 protein [bacterium]|nr:glycoside hydrolase family 57 protein [bacterium]